jgi:hypothetical protein
VASVVEGRGVLKVLIVRSEGKRPLERPRRRWKNSIKMYLREIGVDGSNWIQLAQDRAYQRAYFITVMNFRVP